MVYRDHFPNCLECRAPLESFKVVGVSYGLCTQCKGAWVRFAELHRMFDFMDPLADPILVRHGSSSRACLDCRASMTIATLRAGFDPSLGVAGGGLRWTALVEVPVPGRYDLGFSVQRPGLPLEYVYVTGPVIKVGRLASAQLRIDHPSVGRLHAVIEIDNDGPTLIDLGASAGTVVNGMRRNKALLCENDDIRFGDVRLVVLPREQRPDRVREHTSVAKEVFATERFAALSPIRVEVDVCERHGIWFDKDELQAAMQAAGGIHA